MSDKFRNAKDAITPDSRSVAFGRTLENLQLSLDKLSLNDNVPESVRIHFDTTRNLLLYSHFVYRFIRVAEWHACASLELALRERIKASSLNLAKPPKGLYALIKFAIGKGWVKDENFSIWKEAKQSQEEMREIYKALGAALEDITFQFDCLGMLNENIPTIRNEYAHGSRVLYPNVYNHLLLVSEFINQLF